MGKNRREKALDSLGIPVKGDRYTGRELNNMKNKLSKIINHAIEQGYEECWYEDWGNEENEGRILFPHSHPSLSINELLLSHPFAKKFFGEEEGEYKYNTCIHCGGYGDPGDGHICWQYHLQKAVISTSVIDYYFKYMEDNK